jgi:hypothetical protein
MHSNYLIDQAYTKKGNIIMCGVSADWLLVPNAINRHPISYLK